MFYTGIWGFLSHTSQMQTRSYRLADVSGIYLAPMLALCIFTCRYEKICAHTRTTSAGYFYVSNNNLHPVVWLHWLTWRREHWVYLTVVGRNFHIVDANGKCINIVCKAFKHNLRVTEAGYYSYIFYIVVSHDSLHNPNSVLVPGYGKQYFCKFLGTFFFQCFVCSLARTYIE